MRQPVLPNELQDCIPSEVRFVLQYLHHPRRRLQHLPDEKRLYPGSYSCSTTALAYTCTTWTGSYW